MRANGRMILGGLGLALALSASACKDKGEGGPGPSGPGNTGAGGNSNGNARGERSSYFLTSSSLERTGAKVIGAQALTVGQGARPCTIAGTAGLCVTPTRARGKVVNLSLGRGADPAPGTPGVPPPSGPPSGGPPARLFGSGEGLDRDGKIALAPFDLAAPKAIPGAGNLPDVPPGTSFGQLDTLFGYMDVQFPIDGRFWTLRFAFYPQPLADDPAVKMCANQQRQANIAKNGDVIAGAPAFARGDVLYCDKATATEECAPGDFQWLDDDTAMLSAVRPAKPRQLPFIVQEGVTCKLHPEGPTPANHNQPGELVMNGFRMTSRLTTPLSLWGRYQMCNIVFSMKDAAGVTTEGTSISATINYDLDGFVFFPGVSDAAAASLPQLLRAATLTPLHARQALGPGPASGQFASATVTIALGNEPLAACGGPDNWDGGAGPSDAGFGDRPGGPGPMDMGGPPMEGPGPSDAANGIHPPTTMPPGCMPDQPVRLTAEGGAACEHKACPAPEWRSFPYTPWSMKSYKDATGKDCQAFCLSQTCPAGSGPPQMISCMPSCQ